MIIGPQQREYLAQNDYPLLRSSRTAGEATPWYGMTQLMRAFYEEAERDGQHTAGNSRLLTTQTWAQTRYDKSQIVAKLRGARMRKRAKEGRCEGAKPYGFYEGEAAVIERMKELRAEGLGFDRIAARMNEEGIQTRTRGRWHGVMVNRILSRPA